MRRSSRLIAALAVLVLALTPSLADARAGSGASSGSRGTRTYSAPPSTSTAPSAAQPMQRTITPQAPAPSQSPGFASPQPQLSPRSGFMSGIAGGLLGAGIGSMLFGGGGFFHGISGFGGVLGFIIQIALIFFIGRFLIRLFMNRRPAMAGGPTMFNPGGNQAPPRSMGGGGGPMAPRVDITPTDFQSFEKLLQSVQAAWTQHDLNTLRMVATPEMVAYFGEQLAEQTSRGERNAVTDVKLEQGDLSEAWAEDGREYATVAMRFSMLDVTRDSTGRVTAGSPDQRGMATEIWTFLRAPGGRWVLSAIQQVR
jgi:predicted lipid-binding transport protein (Tim44 family)